MSADLNQAYVADSGLLKSEGLPTGAGTQLQRR